jgi:hypothetical protein
MNIFHNIEVRQPKAHYPGGPPYFYPNCRVVRLHRPEGSNPLRLVPCQEIGAEMPDAHPNIGN